MNIKSGFLYNTTCFVTGFAILVFELLSFRMLAPYFGNSSIVIGTIINSILLALAIGYYLGGYIADRKKSHNLIYQVIVISACYIFLVYLTYPVFLKSIAGMPVILGSVIAIVILFFPPMILLSFVPPYLIKLISSKDDIGISSGKIFSLSTLGSIMGGIFTTFFLIPFIGTKISVLVSAIILFLLGLTGLRNARLLSLAVVFGLLSPFALSARSESKIIYQDESVYNIITVEQDGEICYLRLNDSIGHHSVTINEKTVLTGTFSDMHLFPYIFIDARKALVLGNGAGNIMMQVSRFSPAQIDGVEIDSEITRVGEKYFGLNLDDKRRVYHEDARVFLQKNKEKYDVIHVDLFAGNPYIPFHLATIEFFRLIADSLADDGALVVNYPRFIEHDEQLSGYYLGTIKNIFPSVIVSDEAVFAFKRDISADRIKSLIVSKKPTGTLFIVARDALKKFSDVGSVSHFFSDDFAPIDMMTYRALKR
ncbi:MAG: fused MFS/spermidine synthase [Pseudomonadota bacterium]